jgi:hypothetical protein
VAEPPCVPVLTISGRRRSGPAFGRSCQRAMNVSAVRGVLWYGGLSQEL